MDTNQTRRLEPELVQFLDQFGDCFARKDTRWRGWGLPSRRSKERVLAKAAS